MASAYGLLRALLALGGLGVTGYAAMARFLPRAPLLGAKETRIADAIDASLVKIRGVATPTDAGTVVAPFSGRSCLFVRTTLARLGPHARADSRRNEPRIEETLSRPMTIVDRENHWARVEDVGAGAPVSGKRETVVRSPPNDDHPDPRIEAFLTARGSSSERLREPGLRPRGSIWVIEERIEPGDAICAIGRVQRRSAGESGGYRGSGMAEIDILPHSPEMGVLLTTGSVWDAILSSARDEKHPPSL